MSNNSDKVHDSGNRKTYETGAKRDRPVGKGMPSLISPIAFMRLAKRCEQGHIKYGDGRNWEQGMPTSEFTDSALRHMMQYLDGDNSEDHLAAVMWNIMCIIHMEEKMPEMQDIPSRKGLSDSDYEENKTE